MSPHAQPDFLIGVDGGGTRCRAQLTDRSGRILSESTAGPANIRLGLDLAWSHILKAVDSTLDLAGLTRSDLTRAAVGLGLAGIITSRDAERVVASAPQCLRVTAATDAHIGCLGAFSGRDGGLVISGTGSAAYAWIGGRGHAVGGWGFDIGDEGSAASLGRLAIRHALRVRDGLALRSPFTDVVMDYFGGDPARVVDWSDTAHPRDYGELAPMAMTFAREGDPVAVAIVRTNAAGLEDYIVRLRELGAPAVCLIGGLAPHIRPWLSGRVQAYLADAEGDALAGALLLARGVGRMWPATGTE